MTKPRVYIETTIPSFYHEVRTEPEMVLRLYTPLLITPLQLLGEKAK